jgi:adenylosuccinate lyase
MTVIAEVQAEFGLIPMQAATEIKKAYDSLEVDDPFLKEAGEGFAKTQHSLMGLIQMGLIQAVKNRCEEAGGE